MSVNGSAAPPYRQPQIAQNYLQGEVGGQTRCGDQTKHAMAHPALSPKALQDQHLQPNVADPIHSVRLGGIHAQVRLHCQRLMVPSDVVLPPADGPRSDAKAIVVAMTMTRPSHSRMTGGSQIAQVENVWNLLAQANSSYSRLQPRSQDGFRSHSHFEDHQRCQFVHSGKRHSNPIPVHDSG